MPNRFIVAVLLVLSLIAGIDLPGQGMPPTPVRYTEAIQHDLRGTARMTGAIESRRNSIVASELPGVVTSLDAREGDLVRQGAPLIHIRSDNVELRLRAAEGELREAMARLELARQSRERAEDLFRDQVISQQQLDDAVTESEAWLGRVSRLEADVARLRNDLARTIVRAPFSGIVVEERTALGEWVAAGGDVVELIDLTNLEVTVNVPERFFSGLTVGASVPVRVPSLGGMEIHGKISAIVPRANEQARTFPVKIRFENPDARAGIGMIAEAMIPIGELRTQVLVPKDAIVRQGAATGVWVIGTDQIVRWVDVDPGSSAGVWVAVNHVKQGDRIVTRGNERLRPGQTVNPTVLEYPKP